MDVSPEFQKIVQRITEFSPLPATTTAVQATIASAEDRAAQRRTSNLRSLLPAIDQHFPSSLLLSVRSGAADIDQLPLFALPTATPTPMQQSFSADSVSSLASRPEQSSEPDMDLSPKHIN